MTAVLSVCTCVCVCVYVCVCGCAHFCKCACPCASIQYRNIVLCCVGLLCAESLAVHCCCKIEKSRSVQGYLP